MEHGCSPQTRGLPFNHQAEEYEGQHRFIKRFEGDIFTLGNFDDMVRLQIGQRDPKDLRPCRCYALRPQDQPLLEEEAWNDGSIPPIAYQKFRWCGVRSKVITLHNDRYHIPGFQPESKQTYPDRLFYVDLQYDEDVYVADINAGKEYFDRLSSTRHNVRAGRFDLLESFRVTARTLIPISQYYGQFREPTILIRRELLFDEVKYIKSFTRK
ncbi:hypothetical protein HGA34_05710 [Candidatus Falkowbacteria bacterium]|nr:hypothetical protein [Candidatus Falkowbacteria bacterium]